MSIGIHPEKSPDVAPSFRKDIIGMDITLKNEFSRLWGKYFNGSELPIAFWYTDDTDSVEVVKAPAGHRCFIGDLAKVRKGKSLCFDSNSVSCAGGKRYLGFNDTLMPDFEYFLSCGIPGVMEGERYKKSPELVRNFLEKMPHFKAPSRYIIFKRWDNLQDTDNPEVVIFFATADILSGLFTLANFDEVEPEGITAPFASGCGSMIMYPFLEKESDSPRAVLGMFDVSARPYVPANTLTFSVPYDKFVRMIKNMEESFLITSSWKKVLSRIS